MINIALKIVTNLILNTSSIIILLKTNIYSFKSWVKNGTFNIFFKALHNILGYSLIITTLAELLTESVCLVPNNDRLKIKMLTSRYTIPTQYYEDK